MADPAWNPLRDDLARGREEAFAELYDRLSAPMFGVARRLLGSDADAEDAVQQTFLNFLRSRQALARAENPRAYALASLRRAVARLRDRRGTEELSDDVAAPVADTGDARAEQLDQAVALLPIEQREVLALKLDGELTFDEIGAALGISPNTVASRYRYALQKLRDTVGGER